MRASSTLHRFASLFIWCSIITSSFDIVLNIEIAGLNFRATQLFMLVAMVCYLLNCMIERDIVFQRMHLPLFCCFVLNTLFLFNSKLMSTAIGYELWLAFDILQILVVTHFLSRTETLESLIKKYLYCFTAIAAFGIVQKLLMLVGVDLFVQQPGRVNGFSFEPSYYSTYLLMGWILCMYLAEQDNRSVLSRKKLYLCLIVISVANVFSDSRMGILFMGVYVVCRIVWLMFSGNFRVNKWKAIMSTLGALAIVVAVGYLGIGLMTENPTVIHLFRGLGVTGTGNWSSGVRIRAFLNTLQVFLESPIIGTSLGGTDAAVAHLMGEVITAADTGTYSICILLEVFAAWGFLGGILFLTWLFRLCISEYCAMPAASKQRKEIVRALIYALVFEILILCLNQNVLRPTLWVHFSVLSAAYAIVYRRKNTERPSLKKGVAA